MDWVVRQVDEKGKVIAYEEFPSRGKAAKSLKSYGHCYITRDSDGRVYTVQKK